MDKVRWGVVSTAQIATEKVIPGIRRSAAGEVVAIASRDAARARAAADELGIPRSHGSYEELLADPAVDAVYVPLPNHLHAEWSIRAAGGRQARAVREAARAVGGRRGPDGAGRGGVGAAPDGSLHVPPSSQLGRGAGARRRWPDRPAPGRGQLVLLLQRRSGQHPERAGYGGGALYDIGCYSVSLSRLLFGEEPDEVSAAIVRDPTSGVDILTTGHMTFPGGLASFTCATRVEPDQRVHVYGTDGRIEIEIPFNIPPDRPTRIFVTHGGDAPVAPATETLEFAPADPYACEVDAFAEALAAGGPAPVGPEDADREPPRARATVRRGAGLRPSRADSGRPDYYARWMASASRRPGPSRVTSGARREHERGGWSGAGRYPGRAQRPRRPDGQVERWRVTSEATAAWSRSDAARRRHHVRRDGGARRGAAMGVGGRRLPADRTRRLVDRPALGRGAARSIRRAVPNPPVHARNLFHLSVGDVGCMGRLRRHRAWLHGHREASGRRRGRRPQRGDELRRLPGAHQPLHRRGRGRRVPVRVRRPHGLAVLLAGRHDSEGDTPAAVGNRIADAVLAAAATDGSNEHGGYAATDYKPVNPPMVVADPGTTMTDPNRWQPLKIANLVSQNGIPVANGLQQASPRTGATSRGLRCRRAGPRARRWTPARRPSWATRRRMPPSRRRSSR